MQQNFLVEIILVLTLLSLESQPVCMKTYLNITLFKVIMQRRYLEVSIFQILQKNLHGINNKQLLEHTAMLLVECLEQMLGEMGVGEGRILEAHEISDIYTAISKVT